MRCPIETPESAESLLAYCAHTLGPEDTAAWERHLKECAACRKMAADQTAVWTALDEWDTVEVSPDFDRRLYARIEHEVPWWAKIARPFGPALLQRALPVTAAACLAVTAGLLFNQADRIPVRPAVAPVEAVQADQVEHQLEDMELLRDFSRTVRSDASPAKL
jgi:hypothetical protein